MGSSEEKVDFFRPEHEKMGKIIVFFGCFGG